MIFVTGDTHSDVSRLSARDFPEQKEMTKDDYVIICGDFGLVWDCRGENNEEKYWLKWLEQKNFTTLFIDGNHENFDRLEEFPVEEWNGGKVHKIRPSVIHLMRGQVYNLQGHKFFTFGGARSHDIQDGVLEIGDPRIKKWGPSGRTHLYRINKVSWWKQEMPTKREMFEGLKNLEENDNKVDFIITHDMPAYTLTLYGPAYGRFTPKVDEFEEYLQSLQEKVNYKNWICGHYHNNVHNIENNISVLYEQIVQIV